MTRHLDSGFFSTARSWRRFKLGLILFAVAAACLLLLGEYHILLYWLTLVLLLSGFALAMSGYIGIFILRFSDLREAKQKTKRLDK